MDSIRETLALVPIIEVAESLGIKVSPSGKALCFTGHDTTPSLSFQEAQQRYKCYGCGEKGDAADLLMKLRGASFTEAMEHLCETYRLPNPVGKELTPEELTVMDERKQLSLVLTAAAEFYHVKLSADIREDVKSRYGLSDSTIDGMLIGYAPKHGLISHLKAKGFSTKQMLAASLIDKGDGIYDSFRDRIVFPYWLGGRIVFMSGRAYHDNPVKYYKLPLHGEKRPWVSTLLQQPMFTHITRNRSRLIIAEGITDAIKAAQEGYCVMSSTSTRYSASQLGVLIGACKRFPEVYICFDDEENESGIKAAVDLSRRLAKAGSTTFIVRLARGAAEKIDLNEFLSRNGKEAFDRLILDADTYIDVAMSDIAPSNNKALSSTRIRPLLEDLSYHTQVEVDAYCGSLARRYKLTKASVQATVRDIQINRRRSNQGNIDEAPEYDSDPVVVGRHDTLWHGICTLRYYEEITKQGNVRITAKKPGPTTHEISSYIFNWMFSRATKFYYDKGRQVAFFYTADNECLYIEDGSEEFIAWWLRNTKYTSTKEAELVRGMSQFIHSDHRTKRVDSFLWGATLKERIYWNLCDEDHQVLCISVDGLTVEKNGENADDMVFSRPAIPTKPIRIKRHKSPITALRSVFTDRLLLSEVDAAVLTACFCVAMLPGLKQRPILHFLGSQGSGKSTAAEMMYHLVYGESRITAPSAREELWSAVDSNPIFAHDNIESDSHSAFSNDYLLMPTGAGRDFRKLYTNSGRVTYNPNAQVIWTSIEPVTLVEALQRTITFDFSGDHARGAVTKEEIFSDIAKQRDKALCAVWRLYQELLAGEEQVQKYFEMLSAVRHPKERFNDYLRLVMFFFVHSYETGELLDREAVAEKAFMKWIEDQGESHLDLEGHGNPIVSFLRFIRGGLHKKAWSAILDVRKSGNNATIKGSASDFFYAFQSLNVATGGRKLPYSTPGVLGRRIKSSLMVLRSDGWEYEYRKGRSCNEHVFKWVGQDDD